LVHRFIILAVMRPRAGNNVGVCRPYLDVTAVIAVLTSAASVTVRPRRRVRCSA